MPICVTHAFKCVRLQVMNTGFDMPICVSHAFKCGRLQVINTGFKMPIYITYAVDCVRFTLIYWVLRCLGIHLTHYKRAL